MDVEIAVSVRDRLTAFTAIRQPPENRAHERGTLLEHGKRISPHFGTSLSHAGTRRANYPPGAGAAGRAPAKLLTPSVAVI
ncbi:hypothetical protein EVAR_32093_1 [Eumeta japonica]|uniref:Uncharacterized protein n=1 Tax=Eumeta variegata TaxID=151549 RepID=A0A4C1V5X3_EUMVA|nr:hypothetical protein EVAR_32093_1 [Eumeta japonica]